MYDHPESDTLRAVRKYLNLPEPPPPPRIEIPQEAPAGLFPPGQRVEVQLIHESELKARQAAAAAEAEKRREVRRAAAAKAARTRKRRRRRSRAVEGSRDNHERHCSICNSPDREAIEEAFLHWDDPWSIGREFEVGYRSVYRHAHARGLFAIRERNMRFALGHIIERSRGVRATAENVIRAIRAYGCLNRDGQWIEPPIHVIVSSGGRVASPSTVALAAALVAPDLPAQLAETASLPASADAEVGVTTVE